MENNDSIPEVEQEEQINEEVVEETVNETEDTSTQDAEYWKNEAAKYKRIAERRSKKTSEAPESTQTSEKQPEGFDYGVKAYLRNEGIEPSEFEFVENQLKQSGLKDIESLLSNGYFQSSLKEMRDDRAVKEATPSGTRATSEPPSSRADFWIAKGELPPNTPENTALRREIVNKRMENEARAGRFSSNPIIGQ
jgi:hypothetical protein